MTCRSRPGVVTGRPSLLNPSVMNAPGLMEAWISRILLRRDGLSMVLIEQVVNGDGFVAVWA